MAVTKLRGMGRVGNEVTAHVAMQHSSFGTGPEHGEQLP